jgi:hypothetical protein
MGKAQQRVCMQCMQRIEKFAMSPKNSQCRQKVRNVATLTHVSITDA